ncbi:MAG: Ldh family oxidoreductase, partial [Spirochaetia bacterium]|nr:Ldh family oxidoreductase [Spirochaetia bacterium]
ITMTNTAALGVPTFGKEAIFGTNPIAISVPASNNRMFTLDMSTTCVTRGKVEVYNREGKSLPEGWAVDTNGMSTTDSFKLLDDMLFQRGGGILPLGGLGELNGGHKGFGLGVVVDILTSITSGGEFGKHVKDSEATSARVCHFFGAIKIDAFRDVEEFKTDMGHLLDDINNSEPATNCERVYYAGQKEHESEAKSNERGVPLSPKVYEQLLKIGRELEIELGF